jgi:Fe(3+) dicitrate transport protein
VHGTPYKGFWYDAGLFWMDFYNRTETLPGASGTFLVSNTGASRSRGFEGELSYDFLAGLEPSPVPSEPAGLSKSDDKTIQPPAPAANNFWDLHLVVFSNVQFLSARFTESSSTITATSPQTFVGRTPAFAPTFCGKAA